ncbi:MAG: YggT family protein, partial [Gammaproteobacteria bacterium]
MNPFAFLIDTLFYLYTLLLMLRLLLQWVHADFYNPLSQFVVKLTNPPVIPLRRIIPGYWGIDFAT